MWPDSQAAQEVQRTEVQHWQEQAQALSGDSSWPSVEARFPPLLDASRVQLLVVWEAFQSAVALAVAAAEDAQAALPPVPVWADELRLARGVPAEAAAVERPARAPRAKVDPEVVAKASLVVSEALAKLEQETAEGHGKASAGAAAALRAVLKTQGRHIDAALEQRVHTALVAAGELEGWQRWSADQVREELLAKAEGLLKRPDGQALGGRRKRCASCVTYGSRPTRAAHPTTVCGRNLMKLATQPTRWWKRGWKKFAPKPLSTRRSVWR